MFKYIFSIFVLTSSFGCFAQNENNQKTPVYPQRYGLRVGTDLFKLSRNIWDDNYTGFEINGDYRWNKNVYIAAELGRDDRFKAEDRLSFTTKGQYLKIGIDYNMHNNWMDLENMIYVGGRYGVSLHEQTLHSYKTFTTDGYFEENEIYPNLKSTGLHAHWLDLVGGVKTRVFDNFFMGFSVRFSLLIHQKQPDGFENLYLPGYGEKFSGNIGASFNYSISYFIPLYKKTPKSVITSSSTDTTKK